MAERQNREAELSPLVSAWLRGMGYAVYSELGAFNKVDHIGVRWADESIICVEMKTTLSRKVLYQAGLAQLITPLCYAAVATNPRRSSLERAEKYGIGVWAAGKVILEPCCKFEKNWDNYRRHVLEQCRIKGEGGIGGLPTLLGDGPAIRCAAAIVAYREANPKAKWKDIWRDVPNHYAHARSLQGAMRGRFKDPTCPTP